MPRITNIPPIARRGLKSLETASEEAFHELLLGLQEGRPALFSQDYLVRLTPSTTAMAQDEATAIVEAIYHMSMMYLVNNVPISVFVTDVADALERGVVKDITVNAENRIRLVERLEALLQLKPFRIGAKASDVLHEHERTLSSARILTDVRPIFDDDVTKSPIGMVIVHTLKIDYQEGNERKEFFVAMDTRDAQLLIDVLERAKSKTEGLKSLLSTAQIHQIDFE